jgi:hypothetical protein
MEGGLLDIILTKDSRRSFCKTPQVGYEFQQLDLQELSIRVNKTDSICT